MSKVTFTFDEKGYIEVGGEKYSALEIVNDAGDTALDWMLASDNEELKTIANSWGLTPDKDDRTGSVEEKPFDDSENEGNVDEAVDKTDTGSGGLSNEEITSLTDKLNILFGYKVVKGVVQKDKNGKPVIANQKAAIKITGGAEPKIQADGSVDIPGDVTINLVSGDKSLPSVKDGKFTIKFGTIGGNFICRGVKLSSLEGGPKKVTGQFDISKNELTSLVGSPEEVGSFFATDNKKLTSLTGGPKIIKGITDTNKNQKEYIYDISGCGLTTLEGNGITSFGPGGFNCGGNKITSLAGLGVVTSTGVTRFDCSNNQLTSLNGIPRPIKDAKTGRPGNYWISNNIQITVFPANMADFEVDGFVASGLSLTSLSFAPKQIYGDFDCTNNKGSKKLTNESIGKGRFKSGGGFEEDTGNRIVKIDGDFITSEGVWKDKTYDSNTTFKKSESSIGTTDFVPTNATGAEPPQSTGRVLGPVVKLPGNLWYQEFTMFAVAYAGVANLKSVKATKQGKERVATFQKAPGDDNAYVELGTSGLGGIQYQFSKQNWGPRWINFSYFESTEMGWADGQPTGAFIVNGKNYGAKTASRLYVPVLYWLKNDPHPKVASSKDIFIAKKVNPPHAQNPASQANFINNISIAVPGARLVVRGNKRVASAEGAFIGKATTSNGSISYFAGLKTSSAADLMLEEMNKKGKSIEWMITADPGGSYQFHSDGEKHPANTPRGIPVALKW
jgi:hypothetical protein